MKEMEWRPIIERLKAVLKASGTMGEASAGNFVDDFCDEIQRTDYAQRKTETSKDDAEKPESND